jgi:8-oxo-dGTP diphosphatase
MPLYICRKWDGIPRPQEGQETAWVRAERLRDYAMPPADEPLIATLEAALT